MANSVSLLIERGTGGVCPLRPHQDTRAQARGVLHFKGNNIKHKDSIKHVFAKKKCKLHAYICLLFHEELAPEDVYSHVRSRHLCGSDGFRRKKRETNLDVVPHNSGIVIKSN